MCMQKKLRCMLRGLWHCNKGSKVNDGKHDQAAWSSGLFNFVCDCFSLSDMDIDYLVDLDESEYLLERVLFLSPTYPVLSVTEVNIRSSMSGTIVTSNRCTCRSKHWTYCQVKSQNKENNFCIKPHQPTTGPGLKVGHKQIWNMHVFHVPLLKNVYELDFIVAECWRMMKLTIPYQSLFVYFH